MQFIFAKQEWKTINFRDQIIRYARALLYSLHVSKTETHLHGGTLLLMLVFRSRSQQPQKTT